MREPDFVIAGAQRSGTTSLCQLIDSHPDVYVAKPLRPEPKFFMQEPHPPRDRAWYLATYFSAAADQKAVGEKSSSYMESSTAAARMKRMFPALKLIFILRHPLERAISNYRFSRRHGLEELPLQAALQEEPRRLRDTCFAGVSAHPQAYLQRGHYADFLQAYLRVFDRKNLLVLIYDDFTAQPDAMLRGVFDFLGVDPSFVNPPGGHNANASPHPDPARDRLELSVEVLTGSLGQFAASNRWLADYLGRDLEHWNRASPQIRELVGPAAEKL